MDYPGVTYPIVTRCVAWRHAQIHDWPVTANMNNPPPPAGSEKQLPIHHPSSLLAKSPVAPTPRASLLAYGILLSGGIGAIFAVGRASQGALGIFLLCAGVAMTILPVRARVEWPLWTAAGGFLVCNALSLLPAAWFATPPWRAALAASPVIHLPATVSPAPWASGFWLGILLLTCMAGLYLLAHPIRARGVLGFAAVSVLACGTYAALAIYAKQTGWQYPFSGGATFGFFPNRNHTATFLITGSITALGVIAVALRGEHWLLATGAAVSMVATVSGLLFFSGSRAGIVFLGVGVVLWLFGLGSRHRSVPILVSTVVLTAAAALLFILSGGEARARLFGPYSPQPSAAATPQVGPPKQTSGSAPRGGEQETPADFRMLIYRDAVDMIGDAPTTGVGLGAFAPVFPYYRRASLSEAASIHPESDWLMVAAEAGLPALVAVLVLTGLLLRRLGGTRSHPYWPLRWACVAAAAAAVLHGCIDVPVHRVALGWWILLLAGLGFQSGRPRVDRSVGLVQRTLFVLAGLGAVILGVQLVRAQWFDARPLPPFQATKAADEILALYNHQDYDGALERAQKAVEEAPMAAPLYFQLGALLLHYDGTDAEADRAFEAQRLLNPIWPSIPLQQGDAWLQIDSHRCASLWLKALERESYIDRAPTGRHQGVGLFFGSLVSRAQGAPDVQRELAKATACRPALLLAFVKTANPEVVAEILSSLVSNDPAQIEQISPTQRETFLLDWYRKGNREQLTRFLLDHPAWEASAWPLRLRQLVDGQQFEQAVRITAEHYSVSLDLPDDVDPHRVESAITATGNAAKEFQDLWRRGNTVSARRVLDDASKAPGTATDPEILRIEAALSAHDSDWPAAWQAFARYLRQTKPDADLP